MKCIVAIGSNKLRTNNMQFARQQLMKHFPGIRFSAEEETMPIGNIPMASFSNQMAVFNTEWKVEEVKRLLKEIEKQAGRTIEEKQQGVIRLDIDLLIADNVVLKPADMKYDYIQRGIKMLL